MVLVKTILDSMYSKNSPKWLTTTHIYHFPVVVHLNITTLYLFQIMQCELVPYSRMVCPISIQSLLFLIPIPSWNHGSGDLESFFIQRCLANSDAGYSDDLGNSDDFLGKSLKLLFVIFSIFFPFDRINRIEVFRDSV